MPLIYIAKNMPQYENLPVATSIFITRQEQGLRCPESNHHLYLR